MTVLVTRAQQSYTPQTVNIPFTISGSPKELFAAVTRVGWPTGAPVARATLTWANGEKSAATFIGDGSTTAFVGTGVPAGQTAGTCVIEILRNCTSAVTVESA